MRTADRERLHEEMQRLAAGDRQAFQAVFALASPAVAAVAARMLSRREDAEEAAQLALIKVFERAGTFDPARGEALPWILAIAAWECRAYRTRLARRREDPAASPPPQPSREVDAEGALLDAELRAALEAVLGTLSPADQEALAASAGRGARPAVAAGTFRQRLLRARLRLAQAWRRAYDAG